MNGSDCKQGVALSSHAVQRWQRGRGPGEVLEGHLFVGFECERPLLVLGPCWVPHESQGCYICEKEVFKKEGKVGTCHDMPGSPEMAQEDRGAVLPAWQARGRRRLRGGCSPQLARGAALAAWELRRCVVSVAGL